MMGPRSGWSTDNAVGSLEELDLTGPGWATMTAFEGAGHHVHGVRIAAPGRPHIQPRRAGGLSHPREGAPGGHPLVRVVGGGVAQLGGGGHIDGLEHHPLVALPGAERPVITDGLHGEGLVVGHADEGVVAAGDDAVPSPDALGGWCLSRA